VIAKAHAQKETGIVRERIGQAVDETFIWNADAKETAGYLRLTKDVGYLLKATGWHFAIGVHEPKSVARRGPRPGIHLNRATARSVQTVIAMISCQIDRRIAAAPIDYDYLGVTGSLTQAPKKPLNARGFV